MMTSDVADMDAAEIDLETEVDRIQKTAALQLHSVEGLNLSLVKKIRKSEAQAAALLGDNKALETKNTSLVAQLSRAQDDVRELQLKDARLADAEQQLTLSKSAVVAAELSVKKTEARLDGVAAEKDALEEELRAAQLSLDERARELEDAAEGARVERDALGKQVHDRELVLAGLTEERDEGLRLRAEADDRIKTRDVDLAAARQQLVVVRAETDAAREQGAAQVRDVEGRLAAVEEEAAAVREELAAAAAARDALVKEKEELEKGVAGLEEEKAKLVEKVAVGESDVAAAREELANLEEEKEAIKAELEAKAAESEKLNVTLLALGSERDEVVKRRDELESAVEQSQREVDDGKAEIEQRSIAFGTLDGEKKKLQEEKDTLENDYSEARNLSTRLDKEKADLQNRVLELEESEKHLLANVNDLEEQKLALVTQHQKELHDHILKKDEEFALQYAELRKGLDDVVNRNVARHRIETEKDEREFPETIDLPPRAEGADATREMPAVVAVAQEAGETVTGDTAAAEEAVTMERAMALEPPSELPRDPAPYVPEPEGVEEMTPSGEMVMVREKVSDDEEGGEAEDAEDDGVPEAPAAPTGGPGEGDTILSEEVMDEEVVEEVDEEEPVDDATAAETRGLAMGVKPEEEAAEGTGKVVEGVTEAVDVAGEKTGAGAKNGVTFAAGTGVAAVETATDAGKTGAATATGAATDAAGKTKGAATNLWSKLMACCVKPSKTVGDSGQ